MLTGWKRTACLFWSLFFGLGTALFQLGYLRRHHRLNPFTLADLFVSFFMLVSVAGMLRRRRWGDLLNALAWAGFVGIYGSALTYFGFFLGAASPRVAVIATAAGLPIALLLIAAHLAAQGRRT